jgi:hypothetical protein
MSMSEKRRDFKISDNFNRGHFSCKCGRCNNEFKFSLALVGILEHLKAKYRKNITIHRAYVCDSYAKELFGNNKDYHHLGKAIDISIDGVETKDVFKELETLEEVTGIGIISVKNIIHIDIRDKERYLFVVEQGIKSDLTPEKRNRYGLN